MLASIKVKAQANNKSINAMYAGWWGDTNWIYYLKSDNTFLFDINGHFDFSKTIGSYTIVGDTLFLKSFSKEKQIDSNFNKIDSKFLVDGDSCIIDLILKYDYCKPKSSLIPVSRERTLLKDPIKKL